MSNTQEEWGPWESGGNNALFRESLIEDKVEHMSPSMANDLEARLTTAEAEVAALREKAALADRYALSLRFRQKITAHGERSPNSLTISEDDWLRRYDALTAPESEEKPLSEQQAAGPWHKVGEPQQWLGATPAVLKAAVADAYRTYRDAVAAVNALEIVPIAQYKSGPDEWMSDITHARELLDAARTQLEACYDALTESEEKL